MEASADAASPVGACDSGDAEAAGVGVTCGVICGVVCGATVGEGAGKVLVILERDDAVECADGEGGVEARVFKAFGIGCAGGRQRVVGAPYAQRTLHHGERCRAHDER